jgi:hypothetical protein
VERSSLHSIRIVREPAEVPRAVKEAPLLATRSRLAEYERGNERPTDFGILFHQKLEANRDLMDGIGWQQLKQSGEFAIGDS